MQETNKHIDLLTWVRGIAAFFVVVSHTLRASQSIYSEADSKAGFFAFKFLDLGDFGVSLFFALSGCALYLSSAKMATPADVSRFYIKRVARIWPAFFVSILVYIALAPIFKAYYLAPNGHWIEFLLKDWSYADLLAYLTLSFNFLGPMYVFNNVYWSLPVEFQFYLIFPLLLALLRTAGIYGPMLAAVVLYSIGYLKPLNLPDYRFFSMAYMFAGGMLCAHYYTKIDFTLSPRACAIILIVLTVLASGVRNQYIPLPQVPIIMDKFTWYGLASIATILVCLKTDLRHKETGAIGRFLNRYGEASYSTYLYHNVFIALAVLCVIQFGIVGLAKLFTIFILTITGTYWLAGLSYRYVEKPFMVMAKHWAKARRGRQPA